MSTGEKKKRVKVGKVIEGEKKSVQSGQRERERKRKRQKKIFEKNS
jgi:hypothetical protein